MVAVFHCHWQQRPSTTIRNLRCFHGIWPALGLGKTHATGLRRGYEVVLGDSGTLKRRDLIIATGGFLESLEEWVRRNPERFCRDNSTSSIEHILGKQGVKKGDTMVLRSQLVYTPVIKHSNGKSPFSIGNTSSKGPSSIAMLDYRSIFHYISFLRVSHFTK